MLHRTYRARLDDVGRPDRSERADLPVLARRGALVAERTTRGGGDVRRGPAVLAGHAARGRQGRGPPRPGPPGVQRPGVPQASQRDRRRRDGVDARRADPARRLHRDRARDLARRVPRAARQAREVRLPRLPGGQGPPRAARGPRPAAQRGDRRPAPAHRLRVPLRPRPRPAARVLRRAGRPRLSLDAVRPPPVRAALHARAGHHPRGHRPREHAREPPLRRGQAPGRRGRPPRRDRRGPADHRRRLLVHARVRRHPRGLASSRPTAPASSRATARSRSSATPRSARSTSPR